MTATRPRAGACASPAALLGLAVLAACTADPEPVFTDPVIAPPYTTEDGVDAWFAAGYYLGPTWTCEPTVHAAIAPSPHGDLRVCANEIAVPEPAGEHVPGSTYVVEIHEGNAIAGHGVLVHTNEGSDASSWFWFMRVPPDSQTTHDGSGLAAYGWGLSGPPLTYCGACHAKAGTDGEPGHDFVWVTP